MTLPNSTRNLESIFNSVQRPNVAGITANQVQLQVGQFSQ